MVADRRYSNVAILLHWAIALLIIANILLGHMMVAAPLSSKPVLVPIHIWIGLSVLLLSVIRIGWRLTHPKPPYPVVLSRWETLLAAATQGLFYLLMIGLPIVGYLILSANPPNPRMALRVLGLIELPFLEPLQMMARPEQKLLHDRFVTVHAIGAWIMVAAIALHIAGIVKHLLFERENLVKRMLFQMPR